MRKLMTGLMAAALVVQSAGCGTIMHPERKGQRDGRIDAGVAILDGLGLLFFIIPGVIAFAVDFSNGTIYLPKGGKRAMTAGETREFAFAPGPNARASVEAIVRRETGMAVRLDQKDLKAIPLKSLKDLDKS